MSLLHDGGPQNWLIFAFLTLALGGATAVAIGRALADAWSPLWRIAPAAALLALVTAFLHYALFAESLLSLSALGEAFGEMAFDFFTGLLQLTKALRGWLASALILGVLTWLGYRQRRARQMLDLYPFAIEPAGLWSWRDGKKHIENHIT